MVAAAVIEINGQQDAIVFGREFQHELFFALNPNNSVGVTEYVRSQSDFQAVFAPIRFGVVGQEGCVRLA